MQKRTVRQALQHVADYPQPVDDNILTMHTGELIARTLFDLANKPDANVRGSMSKANKARKLIMDRMEGKRRAGTRPRSGQKAELKISDLTGGKADDSD